MKLLTTTILGTAALLMAAVPANAVVLTFVGGHANVDGPTSTDPTVAGTGFSDIFTFSTTAAGAVSGSLTTHSLTDLDSNIVEDLDFTSITLDGMTLVDHSTSDANEEFSLTSSFLAAGDHILTVNYNIDIASAANHAAYSGDLFLTASPAPEAATWAMFIGGFGAVGAGVRRRRASVTFA
jgi:hypothetical protein